MADVEVNVAALPQNTRESFRMLGKLLADLAGESLLGLSAFGGWLVDDPFFQGTPARGVAVLRQFDLAMLDRLAGQGKRFGQRGVSAPLIMTPAYIAASCDAFPLELLEIQQTQVVVLGADHFTELVFESADVRLQCERELKSELIQLRQGLLAAAGDHERLGPLCRAGAERVLRVLRGILKLKGDPLPRGSAELADAAAKQTGLGLAALRRVVTVSDKVEFAGFAAFYDDLSALAAHVDGL